MLRSLFALVVLLSTALARADDRASPSPPPKENKTVAALIPWLLQEKSKLSGIPFREVILAATGKRVRPIDLHDATDQRVVGEIRWVLDEVVRQMNEPESAIQRIPRINEVSSHFEDLLHKLLNETPGLHCDIPRTASNRVQRSGYPDLRLVDDKTQRVYYLDPKLYATGNRASSFRTFYYEPKGATNKVRDDAVHFIVGFEHEKRTDGRWKFTRWDLVDLSKFQVKLKAEFQGSNRDMYRPEAVIATSAK